MQHEYTKLPDKLESILFQQGIFLSNAKIYIESTLYLHYYIKDEAQTLVLASPFFQVVMQAFRSSAIIEFHKFLSLSKNDKFSFKKLLTELKNISGGESEVVKHFTNSFNQINTEQSILYKKLNLGVPPFEYITILRNKVYAHWDKDNTEITNHFFAVQELIDKSIGLYKEVCEHFKFKMDIFFLEEDSPEKYKRFTGEDLVKNYLKLRKKANLLIDQ